MSDIEKYVEQGEEAVTEARADVSFVSQHRAFFVTTGVLLAMALGLLWAVL